MSGPLPTPEISGLEWLMISALVAIAAIYAWPTIEVFIAQVIANQ